MKVSGYFMLVHLDRQDDSRQKVLKAEGVKVGDSRILPSFGKHNKKGATVWKLRRV